MARTATSRSRFEMSMGARSHGRMCIVPWLPCPYGQRSGLAKFLEDGAQVDAETVGGPRAVAVFGVESGVDDRVFAARDRLAEREPFSFDQAPQLLAEIARRRRRSRNRCDVIVEPEILRFDHRVIAEQRGSLDTMLELA